jgi:hypothetical protein
MPIDLLDRLTTDATLRARRIADRKAAQKAAPYPFASAPASHTGEQRGRALPCSSQQTLPRSLVLRTVETFCTGCGARYRAPTVVLAEYDDNSRSVNRTVDDIRRLERRAKLPRYHEVVTVHAPACEKCFI